MAELPLNGNRGDKITINSQEIIINNSFELVNENDEEYYIVKTKKGVSFKVDKNFIKEILVYTLNENEYIIMNWDYDSCNKNYITSKFINNNNINIINYINKDYTNFGNKKVKYVFLNDDSYDFRIKNLKKIPVLGDKSTKHKKIYEIPNYFENNQVSIVNEFQGHKKNNGSGAKFERNNYKLIEITNTDGSKNRCYEVSLGKYDINNKEYTFIIDEEDKPILENIYLYNGQYIYNMDNLTDEEKEKVIVYNNPTWSLLDNHYVATAIMNKNKEKETIYIHRLLMGCQKDEFNTVDHINGNKFDNRRINLRITSMSVQNQNRDNVKRDHTLNDIINPTNNPDIPKLSFDNLKFIYFREEENGYFDIEFKASRTGSDMIKIHGTKTNIFPDDKLKALRIKLCHAICIRYLTAFKYPDIIKEKIDNKKFQSIDEFKTNSDSLITEIMNQSYTVDTFLDYMNTLKIPKYTDPRKDKNVTDDTNINDIVFNYINYNKVRDKYDVDFVIGKDSNGKNTKYSKSGSGEKTLSNEEKKSIGLLQRYNLFVELENDLNDQLHTTPFTGDVNKNTTGFKSLTNCKMESKQFNNFTDFRGHTEKYINKILDPDEPYTLETFTDFINNKVNNKKVNLKISTLKHNYPILTNS